MKIKKILLLILLIFLFLLTSISANASGNTVSIIVVPIGGTNFEIDGEITWIQYIKNHNPEGFYYNDYGVYWNEYRIYSDQGKTLVMYDDLIVPGGYFAISPCNKTHEWRDTGRIIQPPNCQRPLIIEEECSICLFSRERVDESFVSVYHSNIEIEHISATCFNDGLIKYECELCGEITEEILNQLNHRARPATCEEDSICIYCKTLLEPALGHDLDVLKRCKRCDYKEDVIDNVVQNVKDWFNDTFKKDEDETPVLNKVIEYLIPGEDGKGLLVNSGVVSEDSFENTKQFFKTFVLIIFGAFIIVVFVTVLPYVIKFFDFLKNRKNTKGRKK